MASGSLPKARTIWSQTSAALAAVSQVARAAGWRLLLRMAPHEGKQ